MHKKLVALLCVGVMITIAGCGASNPDTTVVTGTVTYDGEPLEGAAVSLTPDTASASTGAKSAIGVTDAQGAFTLRTSFPDGEYKDGAVGGTYTVRVSKTVVEETPDEVEFDPIDGDPFEFYEGNDSILNADGENAGPESLINEVFSSYEKNLWKNQVSITGPGEGATEATLNITLNDSGEGEAAIQ